MTGTKVEMYSLPYGAITMWSSENAGRLDFNSEIELWTPAGHIEIKLAKRADSTIGQVDRWAVLGG